MYHEKNIKWSYLITGIIIVFITVILLIFIYKQIGKKSYNSIRIGSKNFTEQIILGELVSILIENSAIGKTISVEKKLNLGGTFVCFNSLINDKLDFYVEYTGTGLTAILKRNVITDPDSVYTVVHDEFKKKCGIIWLKPIGFNNTYTLTMRNEQAESLAIQSISDLEKYKSILRPGFNHEFLERPDGYRGLVKHYGFKFLKKPKEMDSGLMYKAIAGKKVDIICGFATDGRIKAFNLLRLEDDKKFFPPYYAACLVRSEILKKYPNLSITLNKLSGCISNEEMAKMNYMVDEKGALPKKVAYQFLKNKGLLL